MVQKIRVKSINYGVLTTLVVLHVGAFMAFFYFDWASFIWAIVLWQITGILGITVGYHRLLAHQSFKTYKCILRFHAFIGSLTFQQGPLSWVRLHRAHHGFADTDRDPHPQQFGFVFGHIGWPVIMAENVGHSGLRVRQPQDLKSDPFLVFLEKYSFFVGAVSLLLLYVVGGLSLLFWAGCFRVVWTLHVTLLVNSVCHRYGSRSFSTDDNSRNNFLVALLTGGEGWHNNHHRHPSSPKSGFLWYEIDPSWWWILLLERLGLAWDLRLPLGGEIPNK